MSKALITEQLITDIADSIRDKTGSTDKMTPAEMPEKIKNITAISDITDGNYFFAYGARQQPYASSEEAFIEFCKQLKFNTAKGLCFSGGIEDSNYKDFFTYIKHLDVSNVLSLEKAFSNIYMTGFGGSTTYALDLDLSTWDLSKCNSMSSTFSGTDTNNFYTSIHNIIVDENFNTSNVQDFSGCFYRTGTAGSGGGLVDILNKMDTSSATDMSFFLGGHTIVMYKGESGVLPEELDLSHFNLEKCKNASYMFYKGGYLPTKKFIMKNIRWEQQAQLQRMFGDNTRSYADLPALDLSGWNGTYLNLNEFFYNSNFTEVDLSSWDVTARYINFFLYNCPKITYADLSGIDVSFVSSFTSFLYRDANLATLKIPSGNPTQATSLSSFANGTALTKLNLSKWTLSKCTNLGYFAAYSTKLKYVAIGDDDTTWTVTNTANAFYNCSSLEALIIRGTNVMTNSSTGTFTGSAIAKGTGYIYVPDALVDSYKTATNWSVYADQIKPLSEAPAEPEV